MNSDNDQNAVEEAEKGRDREEGKAPVNQDGNPSPNGQDEPRNRDVSKQTV